MTSPIIPHGCIIHRYTAVASSLREDMEGIDAGLVQRSRAREGAILLFDGDYKPIVPANRFLKTHCHQAMSLKTQHAYADDLAAWWSYMGGNGLAWDGVELEDLDEYSSRLSGGLSPRTGRKPTATTVVRRIVTLELFYRWAFAQGLLEEDALRENPTSNELRTPRRADPGSLMRALGPIKKPKRRSEKERVRPLAQDVLKIVMDRLGPNPFLPRPEGSPSVRNRLVAEIAYATGMRVDEICALTVPQIDSLWREMTPETPTKLVPLTLTVTKGGGQRVVYFHYRLWKALDDYARGERRKAMDARLKLDREAGSNSGETTALFVNGLRSNERDIGRKVKPQTVSRHFTRVIIEEGYTHPVAAFKMDDVTGGPQLDRHGRLIDDTAHLPNHTFHDLRHTFAVRFYRFYVDNKQPAPWKKLQAILGHKVLNTTTDIYLRHSDPDDANFSDRFCAYILGHADVGA